MLLSFGRGAFFKAPWHYMARVRLTCLLKLLSSRLRILCCEEALVSCGHTPKVSFAVVGLLRYVVHCPFCCEAVNAECDVEGLSNAFPKRIRRLKEEEGNRLSY